MAKPYLNLIKPDILAGIEEQLKKMSMSNSEVLAGLSSQARGDIGEFIKTNKDGFASFDFSNPYVLLHLIKKLMTNNTRGVVGNGKGAEKWEVETMEL